MRIPRLSIIATAMCVGASALPAQNMLVREPSHYANYGYGHSTWGTFTGIFNAAFGAANINVTAAVTPGSLAGYSALMLTLPNLPDAPYLLTAAEMAEITTFLNAGGRVYAFGENSAWDNWNNNIAALVGATVGGSYSGSATPVGANPKITGQTVGLVGARCCVDREHHSLVRLGAERDVRLMGSVGFEAEVVPRAHAAEDECVHAGSDESGTCPVAWRV